MSAVYINQPMQSLQHEISKKNRNQKKQIFYHANVFTNVFLKLSSCTIWYRLQYVNADIAYYFNSKAFITLVYKKTSKIFLDTWYLHHPS